MVNYSLEISNSFKTLIVLTINTLQYIVVQIILMQIFTFLNSLKTREGILKLPLYSAISCIQHP